jgi:hypothetical protein
LAPAFTLPFLPFCFKRFFLASSSSQAGKKCKERRELSFKLPLCPFTFGSPFCPPAFTLLFQTLSRGNFFFSSKRKEKKCREGRELTFKLSLCPLIFGSFFYPLVSTFSFQAFFPWHLLLIKQKKRKKNTNLKKTIEKKKNAEKGGSLPFFSRFYIWDEALLLLSPLHIPSALSSPPSSSLVFHISSKLCAIQTRELSRALEME